MTRRLQAKSLPEKTSECAAVATWSGSQVLLATQEKQVLKIVGEIQEDLKFRVVNFSEPEDLLHSGFPEKPSCIVVCSSISNGGSVVELLGRLKNLKWRIPILVFVEKWTLESVGELYRAGAVDVMEAPAIRRNMEISLERLLKMAVLNHSCVTAAHEARERVKCLKRTEASIVGLVIAGLMNKEIAERLNLAVVTVKVYRAQAMKKLKAGNPAELVKVAVLGGMSMSAGRGCDT